MRSITPSYEDISVTTYDFRPDPSLGWYRSEHEMFDSELEKSMKDTLFYQNLPPNSRNEPDEVQHTIRGVTAGPAVAAHQFVPPQVAPVLLQHKLMQHRSLLGLIERPVPTSTRI